jgi:hypothetical protein
MFAISAWCRNCGAVMHPDAKRCPYCGAPTHPEPDPDDAGDPVPGTARPAADQPTHGSETASGGSAS